VIPLRRFLCSELVQREVETPCKSLMHLCCSESEFELKVFDELIDVGGVREEVVYFEFVDV
jgi:hypothetical protein